MNRLLITIFFISILAGAEIDLFAPSLPELKDDFGLSIYEAQALVSVNFIGYCISCLLVGVLGDRFKRKEVMLHSMAIFVIGSAICCFANSYSVLLLGRLLQGVGIAAPSILGFVIISDNYTLSKQSFLLGIFNGVVSFSMAFAPIIGSYINYIFNWRANFVLLLCFGVASYIMTVLTIPNKEGDKSVQLSLGSYLSLLKSKDLMLMVAVICFLAVPFWSFIAIAPILYIDDLGVSLQHFGYYQGSIAGSFALMSVFVGKFTGILGPKKSMYYSLALYMIGLIMLLIASIPSMSTPIFITFSMIVICVAGIYPLNTMYPICLEIVSNSKSRSSALIQSFRLMLTVMIISNISYFYNGTFYPIALTFITTIIAFMILIMLVMSKRLAFNTEVV